VVRPEWRAAMVGGLSAMNVRTTLLLAVAAWGVAVPGCVRGEEIDRRAFERAAEQVEGELVREIVGCAEGRRYFAEVDPKTIQLSHEVYVSSEDGWIARWKFDRKVVWVANRELHSPVAAIPAISADDGILFEIFVSYGHGDAFTSRVREFNISLRPLIRIGYYLQTKDRDQKLIDEIDRLCAEGVKALEASLGDRRKSKR